MGNGFGTAFSSVVEKALPGYALALFGAFTADPLLIGLGASAAIGGGVTGALSWSASEQAKRGDARAKKRADMLAKAAKNHNEALMNSARQGALGPGAQATFGEMARAAKRGESLTGALSGVVPGGSRIAEGRERNALNRFYANSGGPSASLASQFGDPIHKVKLNGLGRKGASFVKNNILGATPHAVAMESAMQQSASGATSQGTSLTSRFQSGDVRSSASGTYFSQG